MKQRRYFRRYWSVLIAVIAPIVVIGGLVPNFKGFDALAGEYTGHKPPLVITGSPRNVDSFTSPLAVPPVLSGPNITLEARPASVQILDGAATQMWTYNGVFPGPTIRQTSGQTTTVTLVNNLPEAGDLTLHHHGGHTTSINDGQPAVNLVAPGSSYTYVYPGVEQGDNQRGALHWYHDHMMDMTAHNVWMGLAGMYIVDDPADPQTLPSGEYDVPLMLMDRSFDANNQLVYQFDQNGVQGDTMLVNGVVQPYFEVSARKYRFRVLNASNFSDMDLELGNGQPLVQIGTESGLLPAPVARQRILLGPAERADIIIDFAGLVGQNIVLYNRANAVPTTAEVMQFRVTDTAVDDSIVPATLRALPNLGTPVVTRDFTFGFTDDHWTINGQRFDANRVDAHPVVGTTERWVLHNDGEWTHVIHIHLTNQIIVSRNGVAPAPYELIKESWYLNPNDTVELLIKFTDYTGPFVFHCHLLEHEDDSMMSQFQLFVVAPTATATRTSTATPTRTATQAVVATSTPTRTPAPTCVPPTPITAGVNIVNFAFSPQTTTITQGSSVRWTNTTGGTTHTSTSTQGVWNSGNIRPGNTFTRVFATAGTFPFRCNIHPAMNGTINVVAPVCPTNTATVTPNVTTTPTRTRTGTPTSTATFTPLSTPTQAAYLNVHVNWQGRPAQPNAAQQVPITLTLKSVTSGSGVEVNFPSQMTDASGVFTVSVNGLEVGVYDWRVKSPHFLANNGRMTLGAVSPTGVDMGLMIAGDANDDNAVNSQDFIALKNAFGKGCGQPGYTEGADFNGDCAVNLADFSLLKINFGRQGAPPISP